MKTKFAIGCLVQWYEIDMVGEYLDSLFESIGDRKKNVLVDICLVTNQQLETISDESDMLTYVMEKYLKLCNKYIQSGYSIDSRMTETLYTISDYRREFNEKYCDLVDVLVWGESDSIVPKQMFESLDLLHQSQSSTTPKYVATFGSCKMWDSSWTPLEHPKFTNQSHSESPNDWWGVRYTTSKSEMNLINEGVEDLDVKLISPHKFNGCGLVISSEIVKCGVNIPRSVFFVHEDTAFMMMMQKVLGNIPQYHISNILLVHNRNHPKKRMYISGENGDVKERRASHDWYKVAHKMSEVNCYNLFNPSHKSYEWDDVFNQLNR